MRKFDVGRMLTEERPRSNLWHTQIALLSKVPGKTKVLVTTCSFMYLLPSRQLVAPCLCNFYRSGSYVDMAVSEDYPIQPEMFKTSAMFELMARKLYESKGQIIPRIECIFRVEVKNDNGKLGVWVLDLKNPPGKVTFDPAGEGEVTINVSDDDAMKIWNNELSLEKALLLRHLKVSGSVSKAYKMKDLIAQYQ